MILVYKGNSEIIGFYQQEGVFQEVAEKNGVDTEGVAYKKGDFILSGLESLPKDWRSVAQTNKDALLLEAEFQAEVKAEADAVIEEKRQAFKNKRKK